MIRRKNKMNNFEKYVREMVAKMAQELHYRVGVKDEKTDWSIL